ncbi:unnamed protein product [Closterium sp. Yama58-4]|nr:unnamed protein product [Closterium sp. Yama58-4]
MAVEWEVDEHQEAAVRGELAAVKGEVAMVKGEMAEAKGEVAEVKGEVAEVKRGVAEVKGEVTEVKGEVAEVKGEVGEVKGEVAEVKGGMGEMVQVKGEMAEMKGEVAELKENLAAAVTEKRKNAWSQMEMELGAVKRELAQQKDGMMKMHAEQNDGMIKMCVEQGDAILKLHAELAEQRDGMLKMRAELAQQKDGMMKLHAELAQQKDGMMKMHAEQKDGMMKVHAGQKDAIMTMRVELAQQKDALMKFHVELQICQSWGSQKTAWEVSSCFKRHRLTVHALFDDLLYSLLNLSSPPPIQFRQRIKAASQATGLSLANLNGLSDDILAHVSTMTHLKGIDLQYKPGFFRWAAFSGMTAESMKHLYRLPRLEKLDLRGRDISDSALEGIGSLTNLKSLYLDRTKVSDAGLRYLTRLPSLIILSLTGCMSVTDAGMVHVGRLTGLQSLWLDGTAVMEDGLQQLTGLTNLKQLFEPGGGAQADRLVEWQGVSDVRRELSSWKS